ncbi:hypothetical protein ACLQ25_09430 [Micromonospora sp. DT44]|uniref:hypothetical protein n=1 Tax=Micromonospora sp. DT44 TaxID=3393439 RepID=UPI003CEAF3FD
MTRLPHLLLPALLLTAALTGCSGDSKPTPAAATAKATTAPAARSIAGTLMLADADGFTWDATTGCQGSGGYDDVTPGAQVTITDAAGATVGLGKLGNGILETAAGAATADGCKFTFTVKDVPTGKDFYGVEVSHRGKVQYPEQQVFGALALTIG